MKIYFCDGCNESIPLGDLEAGKAITSGGKIYCGGENCAQSKLIRSSLRASQGGDGSSVLSWVAVGAAMAALGLAVFAWLQASKLNEDLDEIPDPTAEIASLSESGADAAQDIGAMAEDQKSVEKTLRALERAQGDAKASIDAFDGRLDEIGRTVGDLRTLLEVLRSDREKLQTLELSRLQLEKTVSQVRETVASIEERLVGMRSRGPADAADPVADGDRDGPVDALVTFDEETRALLQDLDSRDASVRWSAVDRLASLRDPQVTPFLVPLLGDPDAFVQFRVIGTLRELNARQAVGDLIGLLRDGDAIVREEALEALVSLTGNASRFDVTNGSAADREAGVRIWEDWYRENRDRFESGEG